MSAPILTTPIVQGRDESRLTCTQPALTTQHVSWTKNQDGTQGKIEAYAEVHPYDAAKNQCIVQFAKIDISDYVTLAEGLAAAGRPQLAAALQATLDALGDLINNGIPVELQTAGMVSGFKVQSSKHYWEGD